MFELINPVAHGNHPDRYKVEPYVMAADVYGVAPHTGRGGWTWYTGSAGWMYQAAIESLLGLRRNGATFSVTPSIPARWPEYSFEWRTGRTRYHVTVLNPEHRCRGIRSAELDGASIDPVAIPIVDDGAVHQVEIVLGEPANRDVGPRGSRDAQAFGRSSSVVGRESS